ncbi:MAG TPA: sigma factor [Phycisphaeraceae bacterium]
MDQPEHDPPPWEALITEHIRRDAGFFYRLVQRIVGRSAAEDACQQAFLNVWQQRHHLREPQRLRAYLAQVVVRESLLILRQRKRRQQALANHACQLPSSALREHAYLLIKVGKVRPFPTVSPRIDSPCATATRIFRSSRLQD